MTSHDDAFLEAIRAAPEDDTPRLVYADWLDDHGQGERAEPDRLFQDEGLDLRFATRASPTQRERSFISISCRRNKQRTAR